MLSSSVLLLLAAAAYMALLFAIASFGDRRAAAGRSLIDSSVVYALSLAVYCTSWTFYGSVGRAASSGVGFLPVYLGPTLAVALWWYVLRKIIRISKAFRITSIAAFCSGVGGAAEQRLSSANRTYVPKTKVAGMQEKLRSGDIIAITTSIPGLDVSHTGLVIVKEGKPYYLHAPLSGGAVQVSQGSLAEYLARAGKQTGIIVARPMEPGER